MRFEDIALTVAEELQKSNIPYMLTGAIAVSYHGKPRMTHGIDFVVLITPDDIKRLIELFDENFFVDEYSINTALEEVSIVQYDS